MVRVLLVDGHVAFRELLAVVLAREPGIEVVGQAGSPAEARRWLGVAGANVAVVGPGLPDCERAALARELAASSGGPRPLALAAEAGLAAILGDVRRLGAATRPSGSPSAGGPVASEAGAGGWPPPA